jgi:hypothetical protein
MPPEPGSLVVRPLRGLPGVASLRAVQDAARQINGSGDHRGPRSSVWCVGLFYKGAGPGTHYWDPKNDPSVSGFQATPAGTPGADAAIRHISHFSHPSLYVSITASFAIARSYAMSGPAGAATQHQPGKVFLLQIDKPHHIRLHSPVELISRSYPAFFHHDGDAFLMANISCGNMPKPDRIDGFPVNWTIPAALLAVMNCVRDAELLSERILPVCVTGVRSVW